jgi:predicted transcriptional regulator
MDGKPAFASWPGLRGLQMANQGFEERRRASVTVSKMLLILSRLMVIGYVRPLNIAAIYPEILVLMAIRVNDARHRKPMTAHRISKVTGMPRENVRRFLKILIKHEAVIRSGIGYVGHDGFLQKRVGARYFKHMVSAIHAASRALKDYR